MQNPSDYLHGLLWTCSNKYMSFLCWGPQNWMQCYRWGLTRVENPLCWPADHAAFDAAQGVFGPLGCKHTHKLVHVQFSCARPPSPSPQGSANDFFSQSIPLSGSAMTRMQHLALGLAELHEALIDPLFKFSSGWKTSLASCPSVVLTALLNFRSSANFLKMLLPRQNLEGCHL